jgi:LytS/YehU family sensor histidine kinase
VLIWLGYCLAWTGTYLALTYHWEVQDQQARISEMAKLAQEAQIATLRYQVNPHFLFNTLNSISSLVLEHRNADAELMLLNLSAFVRSTFIQDPQTMIALREEIALQRLYLQIEEVRFSERLRVVIDIPGALLDVRLPALILQPLVENALRHGVERSEELTTLAIHAMRCGDELRITVDDDSAGAETDSAGSGLGLRNVGDRLRAHFGDRATLTAMPREQGGFRSEIRLPLERVE